MRAFSTLDILLSLFLLTLTLVGVSLLMHGSPLMLANMRLERTAHAVVHERLSKIQTGTLHAPLTDLTTSTTTYEGVSYSLRAEQLPDDTAVRVYIYATWDNIQGQERSITASTIVYDQFSESVETCDPLVSTSWKEPRVAGRFPLNSTELFGTSTPPEPVEISDVQSANGNLFLSMRVVPSRKASTLFFLDASTAIPKVTHGYDNASSSQMGYSALAAGRGYLFAANGFGSASPNSCSDGGCAQVHIFRVGDGALDKVSHLSLSTSSQPYAISASGITSPAAAIYYYRGFIYLGIEKTASGQEFNIIDVRDPLHPQWIGGMAIGRSINTVLVRGQYAYVGTDDSTRELVIIDIGDPAKPVLAGSWDAPGSTGFGLGTALMVAGPYALLGRSYVNNADELVSLSIQNPSTPYPIVSDNLGTFLHPESIRDLIGQDFLTFALTTRSLQVFNRTSLGDLSRVSNLALPLFINSASMTCSGNQIYVGGNLESGAEILHIRSI